MMALTLRDAIYLFDVCLLVLRRVHELFVLQQSGGGRAKIAWPRRRNTPSQIL